MSAPGAIEVLVVDDSAVVRQVMTKVLASASDLRVTVAADAVYALAKMQQKRPHVIVLDLEMPRMDGLTFLRKIMAEDPIPVIVCSALAERDHGVVLTALREGAVDVVAKPAWGVRDFVADSAAVFIEKVRAAASSRLVRSSAGSRTEAVTVAARAPNVSRASARPVVIAVGASTGGTQALRAILTRLPADTPGILIVQHMPEGFTQALARDLDRTSAMSVREARDGEPITQGVALIAPGDRHLSMTAACGRMVARVTEGERVSRHRPSVNVLFRGVASAAGPSAIGVILTGMGDDGADGLLALRQAGGRTIAQDEASCVVFGMPGQAIARGAAERVVGLSSMASAIFALAEQVEHRSA